MLNGPNPDSFFSDLISLPSTPASNSHETVKENSNVDLDGWTNSETDPFCLFGVSASELEAVLLDVLSP